MRISKLFKVGNRIVFYANDLDSIRNGIIDSIMSGEVDCVDAYGLPMEPSDAYEDFILMAGFFKPQNNEEQVLRNMLVSNAIVAIVRMDMMKAGVGPSYMAVLHDATFAMRQGAFDTASQLIQGLEENEYLDTVRKKRWAEMLSVSDAIVYP